MEHHDRRIQDTHSIDPRRSFPRIDLPLLPWPLHWIVSPGSADCPHLANEGNRHQISHQFFTHQHSLRSSHHQRLDSIRTSQRLSFNRELNHRKKGQTLSPDDRSTTASQQMAEGKRRLEQSFHHQLQQHTLSESAINCCELWLSSTHRRR
jgi:hypothetical protein